MNSIDGVNLLPDTLKQAGIHVVVCGNMRADAYVCFAADS